MDSRTQRLYDAIRIALDKQRAGVTEIAGFLGVKNPQTVKNWEARGPSQDGIVRATKRGIRSEWIDSAQLPMHLPETTPVSALQEVAWSADRIPVPMLENAGSMGNGEDELATDVVMGDIVLAREWITREVRPSSAEALRFVHALGDSMKPTCESGDILLVDTGHRNVDIDGVYVLKANKRLYIKRVRQALDGHWEVSSDNPNVKTIDALDGHEQVEVLGRAVWVWNGRRL